MRVYTVFITEKPSVAREYKRILGVSGGSKEGYIEGHSSMLNKDVIITWAVGHLITIAQPKEQDEKWGATWSEMPMPIIPSNFKYKPIGSAYDQFKIVKSIYTRDDIERIYYAGDSGREGIYIQALIRNQIFKNKDPRCDERVVWINSFTDAEISRGIREAKPYHEYDNMIASGYARAIDDWLIGMNFTIALSVACKGKAINTGRVMTPTLAMVVQRQNEIDNFVKTSYYGLSAQTQDNILNWKAVKDSKFFESDELYNENGFLKRSKAEELYNEFSADKKLTITDVKVEHKKDYAPAFFNQTDIQAFCSRTLNISPTQTLQITQELYEAKLTTYPRTSARVISEAVAGELAKKGYNIPHMKKYIDDSKIEDHYAIIPTFEGDTSSLTGLKEKVYNFILKRFMDTMKPPFEYDAVAATYQHSNGEFFFESFKNVTNKGYKEKLEDDEQSHRDVPVKGNTVTVTEFSIRDMETTPPVAYTTGSLAVEMEKAGKFVDDKDMKTVLKESKGIGTSATRAGIIQKLIDKEFIVVDKKQKVEPTAFGKAIIPIIAKYDEQLVSPAKTAELEMELSEISDGKTSYESHIEFMKKYVTDTVARIKNGKGDSLVGVQGATFGSKVSTSSEPLPACPHCGGELAIGNYGIYCKSKCGVTLCKVKGISLTEKQVRKLLDKKELVLKNGARETTILPQLTENTFEGKTYYNWTVKSGDLTDLPPCPHCGGKLKLESYGICCENKCGANLSKVYGYSLSDEQIKKLLNGETVTYTDKGRTTTVHPELVPNEYQGKTYFNWKSESTGGFKKSFKKKR